MAAKLSTNYPVPLNLAVRAQRGGGSTNMFSEFQSRVLRSGGVAGPVTFGFLGIVILIRYAAVAI